MKDSDVSQLAMQIMEAKAPKQSKEPQWDSIADSLINTEDTLTDRDLMTFGLTKQQAKKVMDAWFAIPAMERFNLGLHSATLDPVIKIAKKALGESAASGKTAVMEGEASELFSDSVSSLAIGLEGIQSTIQEWSAELNDQLKAVRDQIKVTQEMALTPKQTRLINQLGPMVDALSSSMQSVDANIGQMRKALDRVPT